MDMSKYKSMFITETTEHLQSMNQGLVNIEQNPGDQDAIAEVFRNAHSIKGMAASMGYDPIRDLAHVMEDLMDEFREGRREPDAAAMDLLFKGLDALENLLQDVANDRDFSSASFELTQKIRTFSKAGGQAPTEPPSDETTGAEDDGTYDLESAEEEIKEKKPRAPRALADMESEVVFDFDAGPPISRKIEKRPPEPEPKPEPQKAPEPAPDFQPPSDFDFEAPAPPAKTAKQPAPAQKKEPAAPEPRPAQAPEEPPVKAHEPAPVQAPAQPAPAPASLAANKMVRVIFSAQTASPGVRGLILFKRLSEAGEIVSSRPPLDEVKAGNFLADPKGLAVEVEIIADVNDQEIIRTLDTLTDVISFELTTLEGEAAAKSGPVNEEEAPAPREATAADAAYDPFAQVQSLPQTVRVKTTALDRFINSLGEMILVKGELREVAKKHPIPALVSGLDRLESLVRDFHDQVMSIRMMPLDSVVQRLPRVVRDLARDEGKKIKFEVKGQDIELDRAILEQLADPLVHLLRNCVNHGIELPDERARLSKPEEGTIVIEAYRLRDLVLIEVRDDGRGMDPFMLKEVAVSKGMLSAEDADAMSDEDAFQLIFAPGFSTAKAVGMVSGRGVGMDAVKNVIESVGGFVTITTSVGAGTTFTLHLPRTIAIVNVLLIRVAKETFAIPIAKILKTVEILPHQIRKSQGQKFYLERQELIQLRPLHRFLDLPEPEDSGRGPWPTLILELNKRKHALMVDELIGQEEAFIRTLGKPLERISGLSGVTMLGDGRVVFVLDTMSLI